MKACTPAGKIKELVHRYYWVEDLNYARTSILSLAVIFDFPVNEQVFQAAAGLHGAGGYRAQCGLVEGPLLFMGLYGHQSGRNESEVAKACFDFAERFESRFGSLVCRDLRPNGFSPNDPPHACEALSVAAIEFSSRFIAGYWEAGFQGEYPVPSVCKQP